MTDRAEGKLLPCPFCGNCDVHLYNRGGLAWVACHNCGLEAPTETGVTNDQAITWKVFEEQAEQLKELFDNTHNVFVVDDRDKVTAMLTGLDLAAIKKALASPPPASVSSPAESVIKPTDANISVLIEALYHCGCPAGGMTVGECAEQGVCGCSIRAERIKGCMGPDHQYFSREESQP